LRPPPHQRGPAWSFACDTSCKPALNDIPWDQREHGERDARALRAIQYRPEGSTSVAPRTRGDVAALGPGTKRFERTGGGFTLESSTFAVHGHVDLHMVDLHMIVYTPATPADAARLSEILKAAGAPSSAG
jgi:hypothetical protein